MEQHSETLFEKVADKYNKKSDDCHKITKDSLVKKFKDVSQCYIVHDYIDVKSQSKLDDIAIVQCFYGTDADRIAATAIALNTMLKMSPLPTDWVFVEAQRSKNDACFQWLRRYDVKYVFKKLDEDSDGLLLKTALWNIGAIHADANRLCFIDSDVLFCNQDWLNSVDEAFQKYDVLSLAGYVYYDHRKDKTDVIETIGHSLMSSDNTDFNGHVGLTLGMTRSAYEKYGRFEAFNSHEDVWIWQKIIGTVNKRFQTEWLPYQPTESMKYGLPFKVGSTKECCCHVCHGYEHIKRYELLGLISNSIAKMPFEDIVYDNSTDQLPRWSDADVGQVMRVAMQHAQEADVDDVDIRALAKKIVDDAYLEVHGEIDDEKNEIFIFTEMHTGFRCDGVQTIFEHKLQLEKHCRQHFSYVCFTDAISIDEANECNLNVIPTSKDCYGKQQMMRKDIKLPKNAVKVWIDFSKKIIDDFVLYNGQDEI